MKANLTFAFAAITFIAAISNHTAYAQQVNWRTAGNTVANGQRLGSNNNRSLRIVTNDTERVVIDSIGNVTIGQNSGGAKFLLFGTSAWMKFPQDQYIFRHSNSQEGMYSKYTSQRMEYRDQTAVPNMWFEWATTGRSYFRGNVGIGAEPVTTRLFVKSAAGGELARFDGGNGMYNSIFENGVYRGYWGSFAGNAEDMDIGTGTGNTTGKLHLTIQAAPKVTIDAAGRMGIGITTPDANLHVFRGSAGTVTANANAPLVVENSTSNFINLLTPDANERGILFGDNLNPQDGGIIYGNSSAVNGMQFRTNGNSTRMTLTSTGNLGIGSDPGSFKAKVSHGSFGFDIEDAGTGDDWELVSLSGGNLDLFFNGSFRGSFNSSDGIYSGISDARVKTNIQPMPSILTKINELKPVNYRMKNTTDQQMRIGFIAQDVMKIFPSLVTHNESKERGLDLYSLNYSGIGVIAIKGIQELQQIVEEQKKAVETLRETVAALQNRLAGSEGQTSSSTSNAETISKTSIAITDVQLEQNKPNPFANTTSIKYNIPAGVKNAQLVITNNSGKTVKQISLHAGAGIVNIDASALASGTYNYALLTDGKTIETKKMVVAH